MKDLNVRPETIKFLQENTENIVSMVSDTDLSNIFLDLFLHGESQGKKRREGHFKEREQRRPRAERRVVWGGHV